MTSTHPWIYQFVTMVWLANRTMVIVSHGESIKTFLLDEKPTHGINDDKMVTLSNTAIDASFDTQKGYDHNSFQNQT